MQRSVLHVALHPGSIWTTLVLSFVDPGSAEQRKGAAPRPGHETLLTQSSGTSRGRGTFPGECCFQVIYFVCNIPFVRPTD
jgi:hypothetical protein